MLKDIFHLAHCFLKSLGTFIKCLLDVQSPYETSSGSKDIRIVSLVHRDIGFSLIHGGLDNSVHRAIMSINLKWQPPFPLRIMLKMTFFLLKHRHPHTRLLTPVSLHLDLKFYLYILFQPEPTFSPVLTHNEYFKIFAERIKISRKRLSREKLVKDLRNIPCVVASSRTDSSNSQKPDDREDEQRCPLSPHRQFS